MSDIKERYKAINLSESTKRIRLGRYSKLMDAGYSPNEIFNAIKGLTVEEAYVYYHLCTDKESK